MTDEPKIESQTTPTDIEVLSKRIDDLELSIGVLNPRNMAGLRTKDLQQATRANLFGTGSDGDVIVSTEITLTRDMFYNNLTVKSTGIINTASFRIFCKNTLTKDSGGIIRNNGNNGADGGDATGVDGGNYGGAGGVAVASGSLPGGGAGGAGGKGGDQAVNGTAGADAAKSLGSAGSGGGGGGNANNSGAAGGAGGSQTGTVFNIPNSFVSSYYLIDALPSLSPLTGSAGSGGGGGGGTSVTDQSGGGGGGGGSSGGMIWIAANKMFIEGDGEIQAKGGNGGNGGDRYYVAGHVSGGGGGGGGGAGGVIILVYGEKTGTGTLSVSGGTGGTGGLGDSSYSGADGSAGQAGKIYNIQIQ